MGYSPFQSVTILPPETILLLGIFSAGFLFYYYRKSLAQTPLRVRLIHGNDTEEVLKGKEDSERTILTVIKRGYLPRTIKIDAQPKFTSLGGQRYEKTYYITDGNEKTLDPIATVNKETSATLGVMTGMSTAFRNITGALADQAKGSKLMLLFGLACAVGGLGGGFLISILLGRF